MAKSSADRDGFDPYTNFRFRILWDGRVVAGASNVSGLHHPTGAIQRREGGASSTVRNSAGRATSQTVTIERGVTHDVEFARWASRVWTGGGPSGTGGGESALDDVRRDVIVELYDEEGIPALTYRLHRCWVSHFQALPALDANADAVAFEALTLQSEGWHGDVPEVKPVD